MTDSHAQKPLWLTLCALIAVSCASIATDPVVEFVIESVPTHATVFHQGKVLGVTPLTVYTSSRTKDDIRVKNFKLEHVGYKNSNVSLFASTNPYTFGNAVFFSTTSAAPSILTDYLSHYSYTFSDRSVVVELRPQKTKVTLEDDQGEPESDEREQRRLKELEQLKKDKEEAQRKLREERDRLRDLDRQRLREEQERLRLAAEQRDREAKAAAEAKELLELERQKVAADAMAKAKAEAEAKAKAEAEAKAKAEAEEKAKAEAEAEERARAEAESREERGALKAGFERLSEVSSQLAAEREAFEKEKARLEAERARLERERREFEATRARRQEEPKEARAPRRSSPIRATQPGAPPKEAGAEPRSETIDEKEARLLKKLREHQKKMRERSRSKKNRGLLKAPSSLPSFEVAPAESSELLSPSWGALALSIQAYQPLTRELASLLEVGHAERPALRSLFLRLSLSLGDPQGVSWERYVMFKHLAVRERAQLIAQPHGLALYRRLKELALAAQICHSPSLFAGERAP